MSTPPVVDAQFDSETIALLAELDRIFEDNPLQGYNHPELPKRHKKQLEFHAIKAPPLGIKALIAGNRSGKTVACVVDDIIQLVSDDLLPPHLKEFKKFEGPVTIWVGAPKNDTHFKNTIPLFRKFVPKAALINGQFGKSFKSQPTPELRLVNGSVVAFKTYDQDLDAWAAAEVHRIHWDEEPNTANSRELRTEANTRLVSTNGDEIIGMTPLLGMSWVHQEVWEMRDVDPLVSVMQMDVADNPWNDPATIAKWASRMTEDEKRMRLHGEFVHLGGLFFSEFSERLHVVDPPQPGVVQKQDVVIGIDPGLRHPTGVTWTAFDNDNAAFTFDELCLSETVVPEIAAAIKQKNRFWGIEPSAYVIDPSARNRSAINADQVEAAYMREEIYCQHGQNDRAAGIMEMKRRLQSKDAEGKPCPTWIVSRDCPNLIKELERYRRDQKSQDEFAAVKLEDDLTDSVRYAILSRTWFAPEQTTKPKRFSTSSFQIPYKEEIFRQDVAPLGPWS